LPPKIVRSPFVGDLFGIQVEEVVFAGDVAVPNCVIDSIKTIINVEIYVRAPPVGG